MIARPRLLVAALVLLALPLLAGSANASPSSQRVIPIWAGIKHGKPVKGGVVVVRTQSGELLAPPVRTGANGVASLIAPKKLPSRFVVEVRRGGHRLQQRGLAGSPVLRASVRNWTGPRVVYVDPFSTIVSQYGGLHPRMSAPGATLRVQWHLGVGPEADLPDSATFWSERAFSGRRFARIAQRRGGIVAYSGRIAREVDHARRPHRFPLRGKGKKKQQGRGKGQKRPVAGTSSQASTTSTVRLLTERLQLQGELTTAAKAAVGIATGSPSAIVEIGELLDSLLGGGDTAVLKQISAQLESMQIGIDDLEQQVSALDAEVSLAAYSSAVENYRDSKEAIDLAWEQYLHAVAAAAEGNSAEAKAEAQALASELKGWSNTIPSTGAVPYDEGSPGLMAWAQNALAKGQEGGVMTSANQQLSRTDGFKWWSYWWKDLILHTEKWDNPETAGSFSARSIKTLTSEALHGLETAAEDEYGETLPQTLVYSIGSGVLYSVGTVWNVEPSVSPAQSGKPGWKLMTMPEAEALPANAVGLREAMIESVPSLADNPNTTMNGVLGKQGNNGSWPSYVGTGGGYGIPPEETSSFALAPAAGSECYGEWEWYTNGQGSSNLTGAPIIRLCPALVAPSGSIAKSVCSQVNLPGVFYGWSDDFPSIEWSPGIWRQEKAVQFTTCNEVDYWQNASTTYSGLNWGTGVFAGDSPLSAALNISNSPSAYYALWTRPIGPSDDFLVGPVTNSG